jgi:hypothetical protein
VNIHAIPEMNGRIYVNETIVGDLMDGIVHREVDQTPIVANVIDLKDMITLIPESLGEKIPHSRRRGRPCGGAWNDRIRPPRWRFPLTPNTVDASIVDALITED